MVSDTKSIVDILKDLDREDVPSSIRKVAGRELKTREDEIEAAFQLKMQGVPVLAIAEILKRDKNTVYSYLKEYRTNYRETLEQDEPINLISDSVMFFECVRDFCLAEAAQVTKGKELEEKSKRNNPEKLNWLKLAHDTEISKLKLLIDAGIIPKEPDKMYQILKSDKEADKIAEASRAPDVVKASIRELMKRTKEL